jgi:SAM-dependent methyltransferase
MNGKETFYPEAKFGGFTDIDGVMVFFNRVNSLVDSSSIVLDVGCGRGEYSDDPVPIRKNLRNLRGKVAKVIGIDVDRSDQPNPFLDEFHLIQGDTWPIESNSIDLIVCDNVLEHLENPDPFFSEIHRVLKNGGFLCIRTPNRWGYVALAASLIPNRYHSTVTSLVQDRRKEEDVFPTVYKCNSIRKLKHFMRKNGFEYVVYGYEAEPSYLSFSRIAYFLGTIHQRFAPGFLKPTIFAFGKIKKDTLPELT